MNHVLCLKFFKLGCFEEKKTLYRFSLFSLTEFGLLCKEQTIILFSRCAKLHDNEMDVPTYI